MLTKTELLCAPELGSLRLLLLLQVPDRSQKSLLRVYKLICMVCLISTFAQFQWFPKDLKALWVLNKILEFSAISFAL